MFLKGRTALITGSTSGIGSGIARVLAGKGAQIMLNGLGDASEIEKIRAGLETEFGVKVGYNNADLSKADACVACVHDTVKLMGSVDILVNNAGVQHVAPIDEFPPEKWDLILALMLTAPFHMIRAALPYMKKNNWGRIINIASVHGLVASVNKSAYVAAKHGLVGLSKVVALETARTKITSNTICPGWVLTPLVQKQIDDLAARENLSPDAAKQKLLGEKQPSMEFVTPEQLGKLAAFMCSDDAADMRGAQMVMDGGWTAQ